jgi:hypothetical protein
MSNIKIVVIVIEKFLKYFIFMGMTIISIFLIAISHYYLISASNARLAKDIMPDHLEIEIVKYHNPVPEYMELAYKTDMEPIKITASWYGHRFHERRTANGEIYDMYAISVAHVALPFGTKIRFLNPLNMKYCDAIVNDSGPFNPYILPRLEPFPGRQFDASMALAECLGFIEEGVEDLYVIGIPEGEYFTFNDLYADNVVSSYARHDIADD